MSKHSLISAGLGLGLMAASMGASAQLHTFDYSSMYFGSAVGGQKYVAFVPTVARGAGASEGAAGVVMLELFQPATGSANTWGFAVAGPVDMAAGAGYSANTAGVTSTVSGGFFSDAAYTAGNGISASDQIFFFGNNEAQKLAFAQNLTLASQGCGVSFSAVIGTNDQLFFNNVEVQPAGSAWQAASATDPVSLTVSSGGANSTTQYAAAVWNNASATLPTYAYTNVQIGGIGTAVAGAAGNNMLKARNACVPAYTARALGGGTTITGVPVGMVRIW